MGSYIYEKYKKVCSDTTVLYRLRHTRAGTVNTLLLQLTVLLNFFFLCPKMFFQLVVLMEK